MLAMSHPRRDGAEGENPSVVADLANLFAAEWPEVPDDAVVDRPAERAVALDRDDYRRRAGRVGVAGELALSGPVVRRADEDGHREVEGVLPAAHRLPVADRGDTDNRG